MQKETIEKTLRVWSHSGVDGNGQEYITIVLQEPDVIDDCYANGRYLTFENNHKRQSVECWLSHDGTHGKNIFDGIVKKWEGEILAESECIAFAKNFLEENE